MVFTFTEKMCFEPRKLLMDFQMHGGVWWVIYSEVSMRPQPLRSRFRDSEKLREMFARFGTRRMSEDRLAFEYGLRSGAGRAELEQTPEQYAKLQREPDTRR
jgi:hypothetical protein